MSRKTLASHPSEVRELRAPTTADALLNFFQSLGTPRADHTAGHLFESPGWALEVMYECGLLLEPKLADRYGHTIEPGTVLIRAHRIEHAARAGLHHHLGARAPMRREQRDARPQSHA